MAHVFFNGDIVQEESALVPSGDRGLLLGDGLFESMRAYRGKVFRLAAHLARLRASAAFLRLNVPCADERIRGAPKRRPHPTCSAILASRHGLSQTPVAPDRSRATVAQVVVRILAHTFEVV